MHKGDCASFSASLDFQTLTFWNFVCTLLQWTSCLQHVIIGFWSSIVPARQLVMGLPAYGRSYTLRSNLNTGIGAPVVGPGKPGAYTVIPGFLAYYEVRELKTEWILIQSFKTKAVRGEVLASSKFLRYYPRLHRPLPSGEIAAECSLIDDKKWPCPDSGSPEYAKLLRCFW